MVSTYMVSGSKPTYDAKKDLHKTEYCTGVDCIYQCADYHKFEDFKKEIWEKINAMPWHKDVNISLFITDDAFRRMMHDTAFKDEMMSLIQSECMAARPPIETSMTLITEKGYTGYSFQKQEKEFPSYRERYREREAFYRKKAQKKKMYEEMWEKRRLTLKLFQEKYEKDLELRAKYAEQYETLLRNRELAMKRYEASEIYEDS